MRVLLKSSDWPSFFRDAKAGLQGRGYLVLVDATGRQLVNTYVPYGEQPAMTGDPESLRRAIQTKAPVVSNLFVSLVAKKPVFNVSIPIVQAGQVRYLMSLGRLAGDLETVLKGQNLDSSWVSLVRDENDVILARSSDSPLYVGKPLPNSLHNYGGRGVIRTANLNDSDVLHATARSHVSGWGVGVSVPYSLITETMRNALLIWVAAAVLAITLSLVCGLFIARQISESLSVAGRAAAAFGRGEPFPFAGSHLREADAFLATLREAQLARETLTEPSRSSAEEVRAANELLLRANKDVKQFAFAASHDLQEPMRMISIYSQQGWPLLAQNWTRADCY